MSKLMLLSALFSGALLAQSTATSQFLLRIEPTRAGFTLQNMTAEESRLAAEHLKYLNGLLDAGNLSLAAQVFDPKGLWGIIIVSAPDRETARALLDGDPGVKANMFRGEVMPMRTVLQKPAAAEKPGVTVDPKTLESYSGDYESADIPLGMKVSTRDGKLFMQATGQSEFALKPTSATQFEFAAAGIAVEFDSPSSFTLKQAGKSYRFKRAAPEEKRDLPR